MPYFYTHLRTANGVERDDLGTEYPSLDAAYLDACAGIPKLMAELVQEGHDPSACSFEIRDEADQLLWEVPFLERTTKGPRRRSPTRPQISAETQVLLNQIDLLLLSIRKETEHMRANILEAHEHAATTRAIQRWRGF
ncbi:hypothetical protein U8607_08785 [Methylobacterium durans]|uniref:DUF6894 family protein n=1 Tax=Methylobacterium durans TaxID=2202825 RepID=UPI002AFF1189|nr:hypothetical protein [Methylobacterium durans]MEA1832177.1 hypothetical protein [Methylobacterium durans]